MKLLTYIGIVLLLSSCILSKDLTLRVIKPAEISVHDSIATILVVNNSYHIRSRNDVERAVYDTLIEIAYQNIQTNLSKRFKIEYMVLKNEPINKKNIQKWCREKNADLFIDLKKMKIASTGNSVTSDYAFPYQDEEGNVICANCNEHYKESSLPYYSIETQSTCCPKCSSCDRITVITRKATKIDAEVASQPSIIIKSRWIVYDTVSNKLYHRSNQTEFPIEKYAIKDVYMVAGYMGIVIEKMIRGTFKTDKRYFFYSLKDPHFKECNQLLDEYKLDEASSIWANNVQNPDRRIRMAAFHNLGIYYECKGNLKLSKNYYRKERECRNPFKKYKPEKGERKEKS